MILVLLSWISSLCVENKLDIFGQLNLIYLVYEDWIYRIRKDGVKYGFAFIGTGR